MYTKPQRAYMERMYTPCPSFHSRCCSRQNLLLQNYVFPQLHLHAHYTKFQVRSVDVGGGGGPTSTAKLRKTAML
jgi:hypothetical protein